MKYLFTLLILCFSIFSEAFASSLTVYLSPCRSECDTELGKLKIFKGRKLIKKSKAYKTELKDIDNGIYYVQYNTLTEKKRLLEVEIKNKEDKVITLCFDDFEYDKKVAPSAIDELKINEEIVIRRSYKWNGKKVSDSIQITKGAGAYYLNYHSEKRKLNEVEVEIIREFEYLLLYFSRKGRFKRKDRYTFQYKDNVLKRKDPTGKWNGFHYLLMDLRLQEPDKCD
jgi:hypothetical protein